MSENEDKSFIYIEFKDIASVDIVNSAFNNVTAFQLLAMAHLMEFEGKNALLAEKAAQMEMAQRQKLVVPTPHIELGKK